MKPNLCIAKRKADYDEDFAIAKTIAAVNFNCFF